MLPHFTQVQSHYEKWEPVYKNLFEVEILLPGKIASKNGGGAGTTLLLENCKTVKLPTYPPITPTQQNYKYSTRMFVGFPDKTSISDLAVSFNINLKNKQMFTWRMMKDWYDLVWNNEDGSSNYKTSIVGTIIVYQHDREGEITRRVTYHNAQILSVVAGEDLSWTEQGIAECSATFCADYWEDYYF